MAFNIFSVLRSSPHITWVVVGLIRKATLAFPDKVLVNSFAKCVSSGVHEVITNSFIGKIKMAFELLAFFDSCEGWITDHGAGSTKSKELLLDFSILRKIRFAGCVFCTDKGFLKEMS